MSFKYHGVPSFQDAWARNTVDLLRFHNFSNAASMVATNRVQPRKGGESDKAITGRIDTNNEPAIDFTKEHIIGGWRPGMDPRVDYSGHFEFGGSLGCLALMTGFPLLI